MPFEKHTVDSRFIRLHPQMFQKILLVAAIKSFQFYAKVKDRLCPVEPERRGRRPDFQLPEFNRLYGLVGDYWDNWAPHLDRSQEYGIQLPDLEEMLRSEMTQGRISQSDATSLFEGLQLDMELFDFPAGVLTALAHDPLLDGWLDRRAALNLIEFAHHQRSIKPLTLEDLRKQVTQAAARIGSAQSRVVRADVMFRTIVGNLPYPLDLDDVNTVTGGGLRPKTTTLIAGINAGGKTVLAMQWAKHYALRGAKVVVFTTEQPPDQLIVRMLSNHLTIGIERFTSTLASHTGSLEGLRHQSHETSIIPDDVYQEHEPAILDFYQRVWNNLYFVDWSGVALSLYGDFETEMAKIAETGWDPDVVVFDWIGGGIDGGAGDGGKVRPELRILYKDAIEALIRHGKEHARIMIAVAQLNKTLAGNKKIVVMSDLAECKSMTDNVTNFVGLSSVKSKDAPSNSGPTTLLAPKQYLNFDKARFGSGGLVPVTVAFRIQTFLPVSQRL